MEHRLMTEDEKVAVFRKRMELEEAGLHEEAIALQKTAPIPAYIARVVKEQFGADALVKCGYNLAEAEAAYGSDWLNR